MAETKPMVLYIGTYSDKELALQDLDEFEHLHDVDVIGDYDAAVIDQEDGKPHIVKRVDHPRIRAIPEFFGGDPLPRKELHEAAKQLGPGEVALVVVGEPTIATAVDKAATRAAKVVKHDFAAATDQITREVHEALTS